MEERPREFGVVGLGRMGGNLARQGLEKGMRVVGLTRGSAPDDLIAAGLIEIRHMAGFTQHLSPPRRVFLYIPAGAPIDSVLHDLVSHLETGDIILDGGNSYWGDSIRRAQWLQDQGLRFVDLGTSGGVTGARHGACFMAGGAPEAIAHVEPVLRELAVDGGYVHAGSSGAGHFVKLVHNGIEFGMLQAIAEGIGLLKHYRDELDIADILHCWNHGSVIRSWLVELMEQTYRTEDGLEKVPAYVEDTGEVNWLVHDAMQMEVAVPVIAQSVMQLFASRDRHQYWARAIAMMRHGFGAHPYGPDEAIAKERQQGRVGAFVGPHD